jgi:hypothetical protein
MKTLSAAICLAASSMVLFAQGTVIYDNNVAGVPGSGVVAPVFEPELSDPTLVIQGNTATGVPPGTAVYTGIPLTGPGWTAQLWAALGADALEADLAAVTNSAAPFRSDSPGFIQAPPAELTIPGVDYGEVAKLQLRVWNNVNGTITSFEQAQLAEVEWGVSKVFVLQLNDSFEPGPNLTGLESFNVHIPEPSTFLLGLFGFGAMVFLRRRS